MKLNSETIRNAWVLTVFFTAICAPRPAHSDPSKKARGLASTTAGSNEAAKTFGFQSLMALIGPKASSPAVSSIDQLLPLLPESYRKHFALMLQSGSLQSASPISPRVVSYGSYDNLDPIMGGTNLDHLYLAFQSEPSGQYANTLEVIEWVPQVKNFQFYQIDFPITPTSVTKNPESCKLCHGTPLRPNWSAYPRWDGAVGNNNGLDGKFAASPPNISPELTQTFVANLRRNNDRLKPLDFTAFLTGGLEYPNAYLSDKISSELKSRDVVLIRNSPDYKRLKYALAGAFLECSNFDQFFSPALINTLQQGVSSTMKSVPPSAGAGAGPLTFDQLLKMTFPLVERNGTHLGNLYVNEAYITTWLRFIFEGTGQFEFFRNLLGNPMNKPATDPGWTYDFVGFASRLTALRDQYLADAVGDFPENMELYTNTVLSPNDSPVTASDISITADGDSSCKKLAAMSRNATAHYVPSPTFTPLAGPKPTTASGLFKNYCSACHGVGANLLPLDDLSALKIYRSRKGESISERLSRKEMPPSFAPQPDPVELKTMLGAVN